MKSIMEPSNERPEAARHDPDHPAPASNRGAIAALVVVLALVAVGWFLTQGLHKSGQMQDCVASGRTNCAPIDTGK